MRGISEIDVVIKYFYQHKGAAVEINLFELKQYFKKMTIFLVNSRYLRDSFTKAAIYYKPNNIMFIGESDKFFCIRNVNKVIKNGNTFLIYDDDYEYVINTE